MGIRNERGCVCTSSVYDQKKVKSHYASYEDRVHTLFTEPEHWGKNELDEVETKSYTKTNYWS